MMPPLVGRRIGLAAATMLALGLTARPAPAAPPDPGSDDFDWVQLNNGEWFKGEITDLLDDAFEFDSDELDGLSLDWDDVHRLSSSRVNTVVLQDRSTLEGTLQIEGDTVVVGTADGDRTVARDDVRSIIPGTQTESNYWSGKISAGLSLRRGNVDQTDITWSLAFERRDALSRLTLEYDGAYSEVDDARTADNHRGLANYDVYLTERFYVRPIRLDYYRDEFQNIEYRLTPSVGAGYDLVDDADFGWTMTGGVGWEFVRYVEAPPGGTFEDDSLVALLGTRVDWTINDKVDTGLEFDITVPLDDGSAFNSRAKVFAEVELTDDLDLDVQVIWDRVNAPEPLADGSLPEQDEVRLFVGLGWSF